MTVQNAHKIIANDFLISNLVSSGNLELNAFFPGIAEALLESLDLLTNTVSKFNNLCIKHLSVNKEKCLSNLEKSSALITPLINIIGYDKASNIVKKAEGSNRSIKEVLLEENLFTEVQLNKLLDPHNITKPGLVKGDEE